MSIRAKNCTKILGYLCRALFLPYFKINSKYKLISTTFRAGIFEDPHYRAKKLKYYRNITRQTKLFKTYKKTVNIKTKCEKTTEILDFEPKMCYNNLTKHKRNQRFLCFGGHFIITLRIDGTTHRSFPATLRCRCLKIRWIFC